NAGAEASNYPFCTIECNRGVVPVPDGRLERLAGILRPDEIIPATITYVDIAGLVEGASRGEGLGNKFLHHVREATILAHVLRCFHDPDVSHVHGEVDPVRDLEIVETELLLADLDRIDTWLSRERVHARSLKKGERRDLDFLEKVRDRIASGRRVPSGEVPTTEAALFEELQLLTAKPEIYVLNADERGASSGACAAAVERLGPGRTIVLSAKIEGELADLAPDEREEFRRELGIEGDARTRFIEKCHELLGLIRYYTAAHGKLQAWSVRAGTKAPAAAGKIHSDMESGFIRAKVVGYEDLVRYGGEAEAQHHGALRTEGHDYEIRDGDVVEYLFNR
ncbi:MAG: redox-regulated ATPase YchF, partial [Candidatus Krumholzibacteria bacterium]|nr:redox-regulated ATPase YchF [Candidatus Krumholzibacteria bacterium]